MDHSLEPEDPMLADALVAEDAPTSPPGAVTNVVVGDPSVGVGPMATPSPSTEADGGDSKVKTAALVAGATALVNKVRKEAPKKVHELREKRAAGRHVIVTEADGQAVAIGPYKDHETASQDLFKVGGDARIVELRSEAAFFAPHEATG